MVTGSGTVVLWSDLGKIGGKENWKCMVLFPMHWCHQSWTCPTEEWEEPRRYSEDYGDICGLFYNCLNNTCLPGF